MAKSPCRRESSAKPAAVPFCYDRKFDGHDQLTRPQIGLEQSLEEILGFHLALACAAAQDQRCSQRDGTSRQLCRRIGIGQASAKRAAVADRDVTDVRSGLGQQR